MKPFSCQTIALRLFGVLAMLSAVGIMGFGGTAAYAASNHQVSFQASYSGTLAFTSPSTAVLSGTGIATYLGKGPYAGHDTITSITNGVPATDVLVETLTAASGDTLTFTCTDVLTQTSPGVFHGAGSWVVTGGTGRFSGATGSGTADTRVDLTTTPKVFSKQLTGTITAPNP